MPLIKKGTENITKELKKKNIQNKKENPKFFSSKERK